MRKFTWKSLYKPISAMMLLLASSGAYAQYCTPTSEYECSDGDYLNSFILTGENNTAINNLNTGCSATGYEDNTALPAVSLAQGGTYLPAISAGYEEDFAAIWIDFNNNNVFESSELTAFRDQGLDTTLTNLNLLIPAAAPLGNHRMRVTVYYPGLFEDITSANINPCNTGNDLYNYGETQDYTINVITPPACSSPLNFSALVTGTAVTLSWVGTGNYIIEYGPAGFTPGTGAAAGAGTIVATSSSPQTISNLAVSSAYDFYIRHDCSVSSNGYSVNTSLLNIQTQAAAPPNDLCSGATVLVPGITCNAIAGTTVSATASGNNSTSCEINGNNGDVWYSFVAGSPSYYIGLSDITATNAAQYNSIYGVTLFSGSCSALTEQGCLLGQLYNGLDSNLLSLVGLQIGTTYYFRLWKDVIYNEDGDEIEGDLNFNICLQEVPPPPPNDSCVNAIHIPLSTASLTQSVMGTLVEATTEYGLETPPCSDGGETNDVWYAVTPPPSGNLVIQVSGVDPGQAPDFVLQVYQGACGTGLSSWICTTINGEPGSPSEFLPTLSINSTSPDTVLLIRVVANSAAAVGPFVITAWDSLGLNSIPLAINLTSVSARNVGAFNQINWSTASEDKGDYFELERSADGKTFGFLSKIMNYGKASEYVYIDKSPLNGINYYRLKLMNASGKHVYSKVVQATLSATEQTAVEVYPNPTTKAVTVHVYGSANGSVMLTDVSGRNIYQAQMKGDEMSIDMSSLVKGFYFVHYTDNNINKVIKVNKQ